MTFSTRAMRLLLVVAFILPVGLAGYGNSVTAEVAGTSYTSPHFDYSITWQLPWYVTEDDTDDNGFDVLGLADDQSMVYFSGGRSSASSPARVIQSYASQFMSAPEWSDFHQLDASECPITPAANYAAGCFLGNQLFSDGTRSPVGVLFQAWDLGDGIDLLFEGYVGESEYAAYLSKWQQFGVYPPGATVPIQAAGGCDSFVEDDIAFCFDPNLDARDRDEIPEAIRLGQDAIARYFGDPDLTGVRVNGFASVSSDGPENLATTLDRSITVYAGSRVWQSIAPVERVQTLVHEFFHVYQNAMIAQNDSDVPLWFTEGTAEAVGYLAAAQLGVTDQQEFYELAAYSLTEFPIAESLADLQPNGSMTADAYPVAYIAIQYLLGSRGLSISAIGDVYAELADGAHFEQAFETVFGETLDQFSADYQQWLPTVVEITELPADFWPNDGGSSPAAITLQSIPAQAAPGQQIVIVGRTDPLAECEATLQFDTGDEPRQTFANGNGEVFWLVSVPENAPAGPAGVTLSCGAGPVSTSISIT